MIRILLIDESGADKEYVEGALQAEGREFDVIPVSSRREFESCLGRNGYDVILSGLSVIEYDDYRLLDTARQRSPGVPILILAQSESGEEAAEALKRGAAGCVAKSSGRPGDLPGAIREAVRGANQWDDRETSKRELRERLHQQAIVAELGLQALASSDLDALINEALTLVAQTLQVEYSKVLELLPGGTMLCLRAGVGWQDGHVGQAVIAAGPDTQAGYTLTTGKPVIVEDLRKETRFSGPELLHEHRVRSGISVIIHGQERPFGILGAHTSVRRTFTNDDVNFMQAVANVIAQATFRWRRERHVQLLSEVTLAAVSAPDLPSMLQTMADRIGEFFNADGCYITLWDCLEPRPREVAAYEAKQISHPENRLDSVKFEVASAALEINNTLVVEDIPDSPFAAQGLGAQLPARSLLALPLSTGDQKLGVVLLAYLGPHTFTQDEVTQGEQVARQVALAVAKARAFESERRRRAELEALRQASLHLTANLELRPLLEAILKQALTLTAAADAHIFLYDGQELTFGAALWADARRETPFKKPRQDGVTYCVARSGEPLVIPDVNQHPLFENWQWGGAITGIPLRIADQVLGVMNIAYDEAHRFDEDELWVIGLLADEAAIAVQNARLYETTRRRLEEMLALHAIATAGVEATSEDALIERSTKIIGQALYPDNFGILLVDEANAVLRLHPSYWLERKDDSLAIPLGKGITGHVALTGKSWRVPDVSIEPAYIAGSATVRSELCVPIKVGRRIIGVINVESDRLRTFSDDDERLLDTLAGQLATALERLRAESSEREQRRVATTLGRVSMALNATLDLPSLLNLICRESMNLFGAGAASVWLVQGDELVGHSAQGLGRNRFIGTRLPISDAVSLGPRIVREKRSIFVNDVPDSTRVNRELWRHFCPKAILGVPLLKEESVIGVLMILDTKHLRRFKPEDEETAMALGSHAAIAIGNARVFEETVRRAEEMQATSEILRSLNATRSVNEALPIVLEGLRRICSCQGASLALLDKANRVFEIAAVDPPPGGLAQNTQMYVTDMAAAESLLAGRPHLTGDLATESEYSVEKELLDIGYASRVSLPLCIEERVIGALNLTWAAKQGYDSYQLPLLGQIADAIALALEKNRLLTEARHRARELHLLNEVISTASTRREPEMLEIVCAALAEFLHVPQTGIALLDETQLFETVVAEYPASGANPALGARIPVADNPALQTVLASGTPLVVPDVQNHPATMPVRDLLADRNVVSMLIVPIPVRGKVVGTLGIDSFETREFSTDEIQLAQTVTEELGRALETSRLYDQLRAHAAELEERVSDRTRELARANERLKELDRLKSKFVSDVSHELRTPVANLQLYLGLLKQSSSDRHERYIKVLKKEASRIEQLIEDILDLSRLEMNQSPMTLAPVDLNALIEPIVADHRPLAELKELSLRFAPEVNLPSIWGERKHLAQVAINLVVNAINYTSWGHIRVATYADPTRSEVCLEVRDTGMGIDAEDLPHLFERFYRGRHASQSDIPGTGLGLAIAREIVAIYGGRIEADNQAESGAIFRVWLPAADDTTASTTRHKSRREKLHKAAASSKRT